MADHALIEGYCPLVNVGNSCYMNSVIQMLWSIDILRRFLPKIKSEVIENAKFNIVDYTEDTQRNRINTYKAIIYALRLLFRTIDSKIKVGDEEPINMQELKIRGRNVYLILLDSKIVNKPTNSKLRVRKQEDASELLGPLLDIISSFEPFKDYNNAFTFIEESYIKCENKEEEKSTEENNHILSLNFKEDINNIQDLIDDYIHPEELQEPYNQLDRCGENGERGVAENKRLNIKVFDDPSNKTSNLIISLKRFLLGEKIKDKVIASPNIIVDNKNFILKGCIIHLGNTLNSGHYVYVVYKDGMLQYVMNDALKEKERKKYYRSIIQTDGYIFLYQRVEDSSTISNNNSIDESSNSESSNSESSNSGSSNSESSNNESSNSGSSNSNSVDDESSNNGSSNNGSSNNDPNDEDYYNDTLNSKKRTTENLPKLLNIFGEYIQVHEKTEIFKSLGYFNLIIGSMWTELQPRFGVDPYDTPRIESLQRTFGVTAVGRKPSIMVNNVCKPENEGFIKKLIKTRISTINVELNELKYNSDNLYSLRLKQQIEILRNNLGRLNNLPEDAEECLPKTASSVDLPTIFSECVDCEIMKNLVDLVNIMVNGDDKEVLDTIMADACTTSGKLDEKKKEEVLQKIKDLVEKYGLTEDEGENGNDDDENNDTISNNGNISESLKELWDDIRRLASENKINIKDVNNPQKSNIIEAITIIIDHYENSSYKVLIAGLQKRLKGKEQEYAAEIQNLSVICGVSIDECVKGLGNLYEKILAKKGTGATGVDLDEKDKIISKLSAEIAELKLAISGTKPGRNLEAELAAVTARLRAAEQERERVLEAADAARASIERERAAAEREREAALAERDRAALVLSNAETRHRTTLQEQLDIANRRLDEANARTEAANAQINAININMTRDLAALNERLRAAEQERDRFAADARERENAANQAREREIAAAQRDLAIANERLRAAEQERDRIIADAATRDEERDRAIAAVERERDRIIAEATARRGEDTAAAAAERDRAIAAADAERDRIIADYARRDQEAAARDREAAARRDQEAAAERERRALEERDRHVLTERERVAAIAERDRIAAELALAEERARTILQKELDAANRRIDEANRIILELNTRILGNREDRGIIQRLEEELRRCREENDDLYNRNRGFFDENTRLRKKLDEFNEQIKRLTRELASLASATSGATGSRGATSISNDGSVNNESSNEEGGEGATVLLDYINILLDYAIMPIDKNLFLPDGSEKDILKIFDFNRPRDEKREYTDLGVLLKEIFYGKNPKYSDIFQNYGLAGSSEQIELKFKVPYLKDILNSRKQGESPYVNIEEGNINKVTTFFKNVNDIFFMTGILIEGGKMFIKRCEKIDEMKNDEWFRIAGPIDPKNKFMPLRFLIIRFIQLWKKFNPSRMSLGSNPYIEGLVSPREVGVGRSYGLRHGLPPAGTGTGAPGGPGGPGGPGSGVGGPGGPGSGVGGPGGPGGPPAGRTPAGTPAPPSAPPPAGIGAKTGKPTDLLCKNDFKVLLSADKGKKMTDRAESITATAKIHGTRPENPTYEWKRDGEIIPDASDHITLTTTEPTENIQVVCTVRYTIGATPCATSSPPLSLYLKQGRAKTPTRILSREYRPSQRPLRSIEKPPFYPSGKSEIPSLKNTGKLPVGESYQYEPFDTHARTIVNIIIMLSTSYGIIPESLKKDLEKHGKSGLVNKNSPIYKFFIDKHRSQWNIISKHKNDKGDTTLSLINILKDESPTTKTNEEIELERIKTNPDDKDSIPYKYKQLFNRIFDAFNKNYDSRACRIYLTFLYDLIVGYSLTYGYDSTKEDAITYYYNNIFKYYTGKKAIDCFKLQGLNDDRKIIASLISYANGEEIPFLTRGGGEDDELIDFGDEGDDEQLIDLDILDDE
jgi:hypothetical protein